MTKTAEKKQGLSVFLILGVMIALCVLAFEASKRIPFQVKLKGGTAEIQHIVDPVWTPLRRGEILTEHHRIRTGEKGTARLKISEDILIRIEDKSLFQGKGPRFYEARPKFSLNLFEGALQIGVGERLAYKGGVLAIQTPRTVVTADDAIFRVEVDPDSGREWFGVLKGRIEVYIKDEKEMYEIESLERFVLLKPETGEVSSKQEWHTIHPLTAREWKKLFDAYGLMPVYGDSNRRQNLISKEAGGLLDSVYNHGDFYTEKIGFAYRRFYRDGGGDIILRIYYDVYLRGSFVGTYMQLDDVSTTDFQYLQFDVRRPNHGSGSPDVAELEIKSKHHVLKNVYLKSLDHKWKRIRLQIPQDEPFEINEVVVVFRHGEVGPDKQGYLEFKNFELVNPDD